MNTAKELLSNCTCPGAGHDPRTCAATRHLHPPITWARFIMLVEAEGVKHDDVISSIQWTDFEENRLVGTYRDSEGKVQIY